MVDASWVDADTLSLIDGGAGREIRVSCAARNGAVGVEIGGRLYEAVVSKQGSGRGFPTACAGTGAGPHFGRCGVVKAPMPGRVVRVLVAVGDHVTARQGVVVVEAMKMENELRAPGDGVGDGGAGEAGRDSRSRRRACGDR